MQRNISNEYTSILPFGKHRGYTIEEILGTDVGYLRWLYKSDILEQFPALMIHFQKVIAQMPGVTDLSVIFGLKKKPLFGLASHRSLAGHYTGVISLSRLVVKSNLVERIIHKRLAKNPLSRRYTSFYYQVPILDGVYEFGFRQTAVDGEFSYQYWLKDRGEWFRIVGGIDLATEVLNKFLGQLLKNNQTCTGTQDVKQTIRSVDSIVIAR